MIRNYAYSSIIALSCLHCSHQTEAEDPHLIDTTQLVEESPSETVNAPLTSLSREAVDQTVANGLPRFLSKFRVKASLKDGQFVGWEIIAFRDPQAWQGVGLLVGDIVTQVNQQAIERDTQAFQVFLSLKKADVLEVEYLRDAHSMRLALPITGVRTTSPPKKTDQSVEQDD